MKTRILGLLAATLAAGPMAADATSLTFAFTGTYSSQVGFVEPAYNFAGSTISGTYTFDTAANCGSATNCSYSGVISGLLGTVSWSGGPFDFGAADGNIQVQNNNGISQRDVYIALSQNPTGGVFDNDLLRYTLDRFQLELRELGGSSCLTSTDLPKTPPSIACFTDNRVIELTFTRPTDTSVNRITFQLTGLRQVPEPSTLALLGLGLAGLGLSRRRKA